MISILHLDDRYIAVDKPAGLLSTPSSQAPDRVTAMSLARDHLGHYVYPIHRLDRGTSGVLLFGRSSEAASEAQAWFREHRAEKRYLAVVRGWVEEQGTIDYPIEGALEGVRVEAVTLYRLLATTELPVPLGRYETVRYSLVEARPLTGRMHQIRRHFKHLRHPMLGDRAYGDVQHNRFLEERLGSRRMMLHARSLDLGDLHLEAPVPEDYAAVLRGLGLPEPEAPPAG